MITLSPIVLALQDAFTFDSITPSSLGRGITLDDLLTSYDYLDRGIPNTQDFVASINRLGKAGMITYTSMRFRATPLGKRIAKRYRTPARGVIESAYRLGRAWEGVSVDEVAPFFEFAITDADYRKAFGLPH
jgi:hypothetical protein